MNSMPPVPHGASSECLGVVRQRIGTLHARAQVGMGIDAACKQGIPTCQKMVKWERTAVVFGDFSGCF